MTADAKLKSYIDRILRCREAEDLAKDDTRAVYKELADDGYEKAIVGQVVTFLRKREKDSDKLNEQSAKFDLYLQAYEQPSHVHARAREDAINPRLAKQVVDGMQTEVGRGALVAAVDIMIEQEEAEEEIQANPEETGDHGDAESVPVVDAGSRPVVGRSTTATSEKMDATGGESAATAPKVLDGGSPVAGERRHHCDVSEDETGQNLTGNPIIEIASASQGEAEVPSAERVTPHGSGSAVANVGGEDVDGSVSRAGQSHTSNTAGALVNQAPAINHRFRPNCQHRDHCKSGTADHCHSCKLSMRQGSAA